MTVRDMQNLLTIYEQKSITKAARKMTVAQPALSQCVQKVEKEYDIKIFVRTTTGVELTDEGSCLLERVERILKEYEDLEQQMKDIKNLQYGKIRLGIPGAQSGYVIPYVLPQFKERYPGIEVKLTEAPSPELEEYLADSKIDIGILHPPIIHEKLEWTEISRDRVVVVPRNNSGYEKYLYKKDGESREYIDIRFLEGEPMALPPSWQRIRMVCDSILVKAGISPNIRQISQNTGTLEALTIVDFASTMLPEKQIGGHERYYLIDEKYDIPYSFAVVTQKGGYISKAAGEFLKLLKELEYTF